MIVKRFTKPVLVAGFFIFTGHVAAQEFTIQPAQSTSSIVPYVQADTAGVPVAPRPLSTSGSDARSLALRVQQLEEEIRRYIKRKIKGSFLSKVLELPAKDFVVYVKKNLTGKEKDLQKDLDDIWDKFK